ncbi:hypothetical protein MMC11_001682 [Xylographa trunciseda]|nr:hypothetical protein [Xylographa trunciseda]
MPRKAFVADLQQATAVLLSENLTDLRAGDDDGTFAFTYKPSGDQASVTVHACISDVGDYPTTHQYFLYTDSENVPPEVTAALSDVDIFSGMQISQMLTKTVKIFNHATAGSRSRPVCLDDDAMDVDFPEVTEDSEEELEEEEEEEDYYDESPFDHGFEENVLPSIPNNHRTSTTDYSAGPRLVTSRESLDYNKRVRSDLREVKKAGFHVGFLGNLLELGRDCFLVLSIRVAKLDIPEDALQAWHLDPTQYAMLLIHYAEGYRCFEDLIVSRSALRCGVRMRVGVCHKQKITLKEAIHAFSQISDKDKKKSELNTDVEATQVDDEETIKEGLQFLFIGRPLDELLNDRLVDLLNYRVGMAFQWGGAEEYYNDHQGRNQTGSEALENKYWAEETSNFASHLPSVVTSDHLADSSSKTKSFPLLAMQYFLRHLVRCTDFCLVCHCRVRVEWEALMPFVCEKPLCLYQYMALGFGPSIEYEILTQPYVVDLLVSFCYSSALAGSLKGFPIGMSLTVPDPSLVLSDDIASDMASLYRSQGRLGRAGRFMEPVKGAATRVKSKVHKAKFDREHDELVFPKDSQERPLRVGDWVCLIKLSTVEKEHRRVLETWYPTVRLGPAIETAFNKVLTPRYAEFPESLSVPQGRATLTPATTPPLQSISATSQLPDVDIVVYDQNFDDLTEEERRSSIRMLLDTLPSVLDMRSYLRSMGHKHMSLRAWSDRISPAAFGVIRWIIASNRSCLVQIDRHDDGTNRSAERVSGMSGYMQFRFAQGSPDKEQRFVTAIRETTQRLAIRHPKISQFPTLFAWHGSSLPNWHGIIREGLHFDDIKNGRAFGNGVYFSSEFATSQGYSMIHYETSNYFGWPKSQLKITQAICLNEIVNAPMEFVSRQPHLVVSQLDWIQTRYLFVKCAEAEGVTAEKGPLQCLEQDPEFLPKGPAGNKIEIPIQAISKTRRPSVRAVQHGHKKSKVQSPSRVEEVVVSDDTDHEDQMILHSDSDSVLEISQKSASKRVMVEPPRSLMTTIGNKLKERQVGVRKMFGGPSRPTSDFQSLDYPTSSRIESLSETSSGFVPGTLDHSTLPVLKEPAYATTSATKALQRELKATLKVQQTHPSHELGWYIDPELVSNIYQWIVELHSFEPSLPLTTDMKAKDVTSIVLELRFGQDFPFSPPFVRVIRPRFLPFMAGGGGHVTVGGALCMQLLTSSGWNVACNIESVLLQIRLAMTSLDPKPARLEAGPVREYGVGEAVEAFKRACRAHNWDIPKDFDLIIQGSERAF